MKCGLEIHQRICEKKLFCECDPKKEGRLIKVIDRYLHPVIGESGGVDKAVLFETSKSLHYKYEIHENSSCLVETDSEPPHNINEDALITAVSVAKHLNMFVPKKFVVMRKTVVDGSNTSGFQRTMIIGFGTEKSIINTPQGPVRIKTLCLEEESARIVKREKDYSLYNLTALGIPLIEISTEPDIKSPEQAYEVAIRIGELLRLTNKAHRGIGTIRQDVNISVEGGARVEIKGFQDIKNIAKLIKYEIERQKSLIKLKNELTGITIKRVNLTKFFNKKFKGKIIHGLVISNFKGIFARKLNPVKTLGSEMSDYVKVFGLGIIHEDEDLEKHDLVEEFALARNSLGLADDDLLLIIHSENEDLLNTALDHLEKRIYLLNDGVPEETRIANKDCSSSYARPLPGGMRMYPETDVPLIPCPKEYFKIESKEDRIKFLKSLNIPSQIIEKLVLSEYYPLFVRLVSEFKKYPVAIAKMLTSYLKESKRRYNCLVENLSDEDFVVVSNLIDDGHILERAIPEVLAYISKNHPSVDEIIKLFSPITNEELEKLVNELSKKFSGKQLLVEIMKKAGPRADSKRIINYLKEKGLF